MTTQPADWRMFAACIGKPHLFFNDEYLYEAQQICAECPVTLHCKTARFRYEKERNAAHPGIWAGELWVERNNVKHSSRARRIT